jgi:hypothetical protein
MKTRAKRAGRPSDSVRWSISKASREFGTTDKTLSKRLAIMGVLASDDGCYSTHDIFTALAGDSEMRGVMLEIRRQELADLKSKTQERESAIRGEVITGIFGVLNQIFADIQRIIRDTDLPRDRVMLIQAKIAQAWAAAMGFKSKLNLEKFLSAPYLGPDSESEKILNQFYEDQKKEIAAGNKTNLFRHVTGM